MDLFTYLMAKNGNNTSVHEDLFSYLLGKSQGGGGEIKTATGITINIPDAKKLVNFMMTKESTQKTTTGKNLLNPINVVPTNTSTTKVTQINSGFVVESLTNGSYRGTRTNDNEIGLQNGKTYTISTNIKINSGTAGIATRNKSTNGIINTTGAISTNGFYTLTFTYDSSTPIYISFFCTFSTSQSGNVEYTNVQIEKGSTATAYEEYTGGPSPNPDYPQEVKTVKGSADVYISNGEITNTYTINLGNNELVGIGDYKDELLVDKSGHVFINKKIGKMTFNGSENDWAYQSDSRYPFRYVINNIRPFDNLVQETPNTILSNYFSPSYWTNTESNGKFTGMRDFPTRIAFANNSILSLNDWKSWLSTHNTDVYYPLATPNLIDLQTTVDLSLFKGVNNVSNSVDGYMTIEYH